MMQDEINEARADTGRYANANSEIKFSAYTCESQREKWRIL